MGKTRKELIEKFGAAPLAGDRECYVYFDTEFTGLQKNTDLISIGLIDYSGRTFYAEFNDYDENKLTPWIRDNVITNLTHPETILTGKDWSIEGDTEEIRVALWDWLQILTLQNHDIQFVSDVSHYDFVLLVDLLTGGKSALDLPKSISACCYDINMDIASAIKFPSINKPDPEDPDLATKLDEMDYTNFIPARDAFDLSREDMVEGLLDTKKIGNKHNSLYDAIVIRTIHQTMWDIQ